MNAEKIMEQANAKIIVIKDAIHMTLGCKNTLDGNAHC